MFILELYRTDILTYFSADFHLIYFQNKIEFQRYFHDMHFVLFLHFLHDGNICRKKFNLLLKELL
jgi:hypothetical protein